MKNILLLLLTLVLCFGAVSCTKDTPDPTTETKAETEGVDTSDPNADEDDIVFYPSAEVVNRNGVKGVVSYVIDDGYTDTASYAASMLEKYESLTLSFAVQSQQLATLKTKSDGKGGLEYETDANGKYQYTVNESTVEFWKNILKLGRTEIISHTHTHAFWGTNDDGGAFQYVASDGSVKTSDVMPKGSSSKELYASKQIYEDLFGQEVLSFIHAGIHVKTKDTTVGSTTIPSYKTYFDSVLKNAILSGDYIGARTTFQATSDFGKYVNTKDSLKSMENRMNVEAFMILDSNAGEEIKNWTDYIDKALEMGGWACFCIHKIAPEFTSGHYILESQAKRLFYYTEDLGDDVWVASFTDAMLYYTEWSTAKVSATYGKGKVSVTLVDEEPHNDVYNFPLTVKVTVPEQWVSARLDTEELDVKIDKDGSSYVLVNIVPDSGTVEIIGQK